MKKFLAVYTGSASNPKVKEWEAMTDEARNAQVQKAMAAWGQWVESNSKSIVDHGSPLGKTKKVNASGVSDYKNNLTAFTVVQAENHEAAAKLFLNHPHFAMFPGDSVEIMECLPTPGGK